MGQQQTLLIVLAVLIIGIAMAVGLQLFTSNQIEGEKAYITNDIMNIAINAQRYYLRPSTLAGGAKSFTGYSIPIKLHEREYAKYICLSTSSYITITAISVRNPANSISATFYSQSMTQKNRPVLEDWKYSGDFQ